MTPADMTHLIDARYPTLAPWTIAATPVEMVYHLHTRPGPGAGYAVVDLAECLHNAGGEAGARDAITDAFLSSAAALVAMAALVARTVEGTATTIDPEWPALAAQVLRDVDWWWSHAQTTLHPDAAHALAGIIMRAKRLLETLP